MTAGIIYGDYGCEATLGETGDGVKGKVEVQCLSNPERAFTDKAGEL